MLNQPRYQGVRILLAWANSLVVAPAVSYTPWAIDQYGFRAVIAPNFADIFFNNCFKNGLLPIVLPRDATVDQLFNEGANLPRLPAHHRPGAPGSWSRNGDGEVDPVSRSRPSANTACSTVGRHRPDTAPRRQDQNL